MNIFIKNFMINMANVAAAEIGENSVSLHLAGGKTIVVGGPELTWFLSTEGLVPGIHLQKQYEDRARIETLVAQELATAKAKRDAVIHLEDKTAEVVVEDLDKLESDLKQVDEAIQAAAKMGSIPADVLVAARARRAQIAEAIQNRMVKKEKVN